MTQAFEYWRDLTPDRPARTVLEFGATADTFDTAVGKDLGQLTRSDVADYRDALLKEGLAPATVRKRLGFISAMLQTQVDAGRLGINAARGLRVPRPRVPPLSRTEFSAEQLQQVFASPVYKMRYRPRGGGGDACAWLPVFGLATGARLEELCQLRVSDIEDGPCGALLLRISDEAEHAHVKTASSRRLVPLHPDVIACGFTQYLAQRRAAGDEWLWPALVPDTLGNRGGQFTRWFGRYLRAPHGCAIADRRVVFHSFRHTFKTLCRTVMTEELHDRLTGHAGGGVGRHYGSVPLQLLVEAVGRIRFPVALPFIGVQD
jgi:integrase